MPKAKKQQRRPKVGASAVVCDERPKRPRHRPLVNSLTAYMCHKYEGWLDRGQTESEKLAASTPVEEGKIIAFPGSHASLLWHRAGESKQQRRNQTHESESTQ